MFKNTVKVVQNARNILNNPRVNVQTSATFREKWDLLTAVLIERKPVISPELNDIEKEFKDYLSAVEFERSLKNETEIKLKVERTSILQKKDNDDIDLTSKQSTQDFIDACKEELAKFKPAERTTNADKSNDLTSLHRKLDKNLVFVINQKLGDRSFYILPQGKREEGETLRQCANRVLKEKCGKELKVQIYGNTPCGFYKFKYPKDVRSESSIGAKVFIFFARYASGQVTEKGANFKWVDKSELSQILPDTYKKSVLPILFD